MAAVQSYPVSVDTPTEEDDPELAAKLDAFSGQMDLVERVMKR